MAERASLALTKQTAEDLKEKQKQSFLSASLFFSFSDVEQTSAAGLYFSVRRSFLCSLHTELKGLISPAWATRWRPLATKPQLHFVKEQVQPPVVCLGLGFFVFRFLSLNRQTAVTAGVKRGLYWQWECQKSFISLTFSVPLSWCSYFCQLCWQTHSFNFKVRCTACLFIFVLNAEQLKN